MENWRFVYLGSAQQAGACYLGDGGVSDDVQVVAVSRSTQERAVRTPANSAANRRLSRTPACNRARDPISIASPETSFSCR